jgi:DNA-binding transcriptional regulator of glucitol operon
MTRRVRAALALLLVVAAVAVMLRLSLWQWDRARASGRLLNYAYAVEWLLFAVLTVVGVARLVLEDRRRRSADLAPEARSPAAPAVRGAPVPMIGPPLRPGEELQEITWVRLRRRLGLGGDRP